MEIDFCGQCEQTVLPPRIAHARGTGGIGGGTWLCPPCGWAEAEVDEVWSRSPLLKFEVAIEELDIFQLPDKWELWEQTFWDIFDGPRYKEMKREYNAWIAGVLKESLTDEITDLPNVAPAMKGPKRWGWQDATNRTT